MLDYRGWLGIGDDEDDDPVKKALGVLGQGASTVGQAARDVGAGIGQAVSDAGAAVSPYLPQPSASPAPEEYSSSVIGPATPPDLDLPSSRVQAAPSAYDVDQPFRPSPRIGETPIAGAVPTATDVWRQTAPPTAAATGGPPEPTSPGPSPSEDGGGDRSPQPWYVRAAMQATAPEREAGARAISTGAPVLGAALGALDAANEWLISNPVTGQLSLQAGGRELAGWEQIGAETREDQDRLEALIRRYQTGDTGVEPEIQSLTASLNRRTSADRASLLAAGQRNPNKGAEMLGGLVQGVAATALAPGAGAGVGRNVAGLVLDPLGQAQGLAAEGLAPALGAVRRGLGANAERVAGADARMAAEGSTLAPGTFGALPRGPNLEDRIAAAEARLEHAATRLEAADAMLAQAADAGSAAELRAARSGYSPARSAYDEAAARVEQLREQRRMVSRDIEGAGYGRPVEDAGIDTSAVEREATSAYPGQPEAVPPFRDDAPRGISLNAGFGVVPEPSADRMRTRYAYRDPGDPKQGLVRIGEERVVGAVVDAEREARIRNADHLGALHERQVVESRLARAPDDPELQRALMAAVRGEEEAKNLADAAREWAQMVKTGDRTLATAGTLPGAATSDRLAGVNRVLGQGVASTISGGVGAQVNQEMNPDDPLAGIKGFAAGALVPPLAARGGMALARRAGRSADPGSAARIGLGDVPPSRIRRPELPGMEPPPRPLGEAAEAMLGPAAEGPAPASMAGQLPGMPPPKGPSFWEWLKKIGYTGMIGPTSAASQTVGGAVQTGLAVEKAIARAMAEGRPGSAGRIVGASARAVPEGLRSLFAVLGGSPADAGISAGWGAGTARMADRVNSPVGRLAARALDYSTEVFAQSPDAFFSPIFRAIGEREAAEQIATRAGGSADELMAAASEARQGGVRAATSEAQDVLDAGRKLSDDLGFRGDPGKVGKKLQALAARDDGIGFLASFLLPFPSMTARSLKATGRLVPGVGEMIGRREGRDRFERLHDQMVGPLGLAAMGYYATQGGITGSGPTDKGRRDSLVAQGWQPHSVLVGGSYVPTRYFQQWAPMLDAVGEVHDAYAYGKQGVDKGAVLADAAGRIGRIATDQVGLGQLNDLLQVLDGSQSGSRVAGLAARSLGRYIPFGATLRTAASAFDPTARRAEGRRPDELLPVASFVQNLEQGIPWLRQLVPERQDLLGRPMPNPQRGLQPALRAQPMLRAFERAGLGVGEPPGTVKDPDTGKERALTQAQQARWRTAFGRGLRSGWSDNGGPTDRDTLEAVRRAARDEADAVVLGR